MNHDSLLVLSDTVVHPSNYEQITSNKQRATTMAYRETSKIRERKQATHSTIVSHALAMLNEVGFSGLQMAALANRCGLATGTLYRYFPSKEDLCTVLFAHATDIEIAQVEQHLSSTTDTASERIAAALSTFAKRALRAPITAWALIAEPVAPAVIAARLHYRERYAQLFANAIEQGVATGELPAQDSSLSSRALVGAIAEALIGPLAKTEQLDAHAAVQTSVAFCMQAISARPWPSAHLASSITHK
ncbi:MULTISPECIES: TetR/AcrR family transcriptional regulator [Idiomarina]|nr:MULTISPECIES: TetR/AcrR family transcriptional regulator [Idiomarina]UUN14637.1 TetR/AcrR family transcriptional regulator [Idiomarina loihiensis]